MSVWIPHLPSWLWACDLYHDCQRVSRAELCVEQRRPSGGWPSVTPPASPLVSLPGKGYSLCAFRSLQAVFSLPVSLWCSGLLGKLSLHKTEEDICRGGVRTFTTTAWLFYCAFPRWCVSQGLQTETPFWVWFLEREGTRSKPIASLLQKGETSESWMSVVNSEIRGLLSSEPLPKENWQKQTISLFKFNLHLVC